jgi:hypothetical protein
VGLLALLKDPKTLINKALHGKVQNLSMGGLVKLSIVMSILFTGQMVYIPHARKMLMRLGRKVLVTLTFFGLIGSILLAFIKHKVAKKTALTDKDKHLAISK